MRIVITGTPGTGKTSVARQLENWKTVELTEFIQEKSIGEQDGIEVDIDELVEALEQEFKDEKRLIIEGHLSHYYPADYCVILRCNPRVLRERLENRGYSRTKIDENVEAEVLDLILQQAVEEQESIVEVDTTEREASEVAEEIERRIEEDRTGYGDTDWSDFI